MTLFERSIYNAFMQQQEKQIIKSTQKVSTIAVFWIEDGQPCTSVRNASSIGPSLALCEDLRARARAGASISHVCISSDLVDSVTLPGVNDKLPADYNWTKRRKAFEPGRPSGEALKNALLAAIGDDAISGAAHG